MPYRGIDQLFMRGVDDIAKLTVTRYREDQVGGADAALKGYRPVTGLLSEHIDALRCYVTGLEKWAHLEMTPAERELKKAVEIDPQFALAHLLLAEVRVFQNQWSAARGEIAIAQRRPEALTAADDLRIKALLARASGNAPEERKYLLRLSGLEPFRKDYVYELAESYFHTAEVDAAQESYIKALRLDNRYALAHNHLGYCYTWKGQHDLAIGEFNRYLELDRTANAYDSLGDAYFHRGDYSRAADAKRKVLEMDSGLYYAARSLAAIGILAGRYGSAQRMLEDALTATVDPVERARFLASLAFLHHRAGQLDRAIDACTGGLALMEAGRSDAPGDELLWLEGQIELERGHLSAAKSALAQMRKVIDENAISATNFKPIYKYWLHLAALIETRAGRRGDALGRLDELGQIRQKLGYWSTPYDQAYFLDASGRLREANGQTDGAERDYRDALAYNGHFALARFDLARLQETIGRRGDARREMAAFLDEWATADQAAPELRQAREFMRKTATPD
jgi:tetratricopeptide (TPR) repeat protein